MEAAMARKARTTPPPAESVDADRVLAFVNTLSARPSGSPVERLVTYEALVEWAREQHLLPGAAAEEVGIVPGDLVDDRLVVREESSQVFHQWLGLTGGRSMPTVRKSILRRRAVCRKSLRNSSTS